MKMTMSTEKWVSFHYRASDLQSQRYVEMAFNELRAKFKTMGVVVLSFNSLSRVSLWYYILFLM